MRSEGGSSNDLSGEVAGPVFQAGRIDGGIHVHMGAAPASGPAEPPFDAEALGQELRDAARTWRARFSQVDFVNLPRMPMLSDGEAVLRAARRAGVHGDRPLRGQGMAPGILASLLRPLFETWHTQAVPLDEDTVDRVPQGTLVSFEAEAQCANPPELPPAELTGNIARDPHLSFRVGERRVLVRFDPVWLTTSTAGGTLWNAAEEPVLFAGLGTVVRAAGGDRRPLVLSALVFGQPQTAAQAEWDYFTGQTLRSPAGLSDDDFRNEWSGSGQRARQKGVDAVESLTVGLFFDEDRVEPGQIDREVLARLLRVIPEHRRDLGVAIASVCHPQLYASGVRAVDLAAHLLAREPALWKTFTIPGLAAVLKETNLAVCAVSGLRPEQAGDLDDVLREEFEAYVGGVERDDGLWLHREVFPGHDRYRVVGAGLRLCYSEGDLAYGRIDQDDWDREPARWRTTGLFQDVAWEEDEARSAADEAEAAELLAGLYAVPDDPEADPEPGRDR
ncbi:hypothetical protein DEJ50_14660 [Streptomyces venezuelae]|uniref:Uncharacterized protein n=1 Tax=Streptomyces venezuelae TaxID=54571 RepID=A0A5P2D159_STRVZ|nr:hypothetical protein [Streptomyces venezuelae]QES48874.1 hypothetical protein DEJ50_14660 [Streptomyces venezuelae]